MWYFDAVKRVCPTVRQILICLVLFLLVSPAHSQVKSTIHIRSNHLRLDPFTDKIVARGNVILVMNKLRIQAARISFEPTTQQFKLRDISELSMPSIKLRASVATASILPLQLFFEDYLAIYDTQWAKISLEGASAQCSETQCIFQQSAVHLCPDNPNLLVIHSKELAAKNDGTINFVQPTLSINKQKVFKLPRFVLRPPTKPGFLFPKLQWTPSAGLVVGPTFYLPLHQNTFAVTQVAVRSTGGMENSFFVESATNRVQVEHVLSHQQNMGRLRASVRPRLHHAVAAVQTDVVSHKKIIDEISFVPKDRAITHTESQARLAIEKNNFFLEQHATFLQHYESEELKFEEFSHQTGNIALHTTILPLMNQEIPIQPKLFLSIDRYLVNAQQHAQNQSRFTTATTVQVSKNVGIFRGNAEAGVLAQRYQIDSTAQSQFRISPGINASVGLPLVKQYPTFSHLVRHQIQYRITPFTWGEKPNFQYDLFDRTTHGHYLELSTENSFGKVLFAPFLSMKAAYHHVLPQMKRHLLQQLFSVRFLIKTPFFQTIARSGWTLGATHPEFAEMELQSKNKMGTGLTTGVYYYGSNSINDTVVPSLSNIIWPIMITTTNTRHTVATEELSIVIGRRVHMTTGTQLLLYPGIRLSALYYQIDVSTPCRCVTASLIAAHVPNNAVPKTMLTLTYYPQ